MLIAGVLCICVAVVSAVFGMRALIRPHHGDPTLLVLRAVAPTQLAAGVMLAAGGVMALVAPPHTGVVVLVVCVAGAVGTVAAGSWLSARYAARRRAAGACGGSCTRCTASCH